MINHLVLLQQALYIFYFPYDFLRFAGYDFDYKKGVSQQVGWQIINVSLYAGSGEACALSW